MDYDELALEHISNLVLIAEKRYIRADFKAKKERDALYTYRKARLELLKEGIIVLLKLSQGILTLRVYFLIFYLTYSNESI